MRSATVVLPVPGLPVKDMCSEGDPATRPSCAGALDEQKRGDVADPRLHRFESDELAVELVQHLVHLRAREQRAQVDALGRTAGARRPASRSRLPDSHHSYS
jgi:hypothetical protein